MSGSGLVGLVGSRSLGPSAAPLVSSVVASVLAGGRSLAVGCASGADALCLSAVLAAGAGAAPRLSVFAAFGPGGVGSAGPVSAPSLVGAAAAAGASVVWWAGGGPSVPLRGRLAARSRALCAAVAAGGPGSGLVVFFGSSSPSSGSALAASFGLSLGLPVVGFGLCSPLPSLGAGAWVPCAGSAPWSGASRWVPAQLPLF